jgi:hypothetical protein
LIGVKKKKIKIKLQKIAHTHKAIKAPGMEVTHLFLTHVNPNPKLILAGFWHNRLGTIYSTVCQRGISFYLSVSSFLLFLFFNNEN